MSFLLISVGLLLATALAAQLTRRSALLATALGAGGAVAGCLTALVPVIHVLWTGQSQSLRWAWSAPYGSFYLELDVLSAFFLLPILSLSALAAIYGSEYLWNYRRERRLGAPWFFFNVLIASMMLVILARNAVLFLMAWEVMSLASFFLVTFEDDQESVRRAGWVYLVATHLGSVFLLLLFVLLGRAAGSFDFDSFAASGAMIQPLAGLLFILALVGFGTKVGLMPLHVWLPEAHPAAPSHVSAVMSGVMIKTGIYGILRMLTLLGPPPVWWAWLLIGIGLSSGILGLLFALAQHDLKRLLAYSTVENAGIILLGLGVGLLGVSTHQPALAVLGFAGSLLHVLNHAFMKGLLFLGAGSILHATHTRRIDQLGGLMKRMPRTGLAFLVGAVAICGLPPLSGFTGKFLIYSGAFQGGMTLGPWNATAALSAIAGLALIGGLAAACFAKAFGMIFLGEPRTECALHAHDPGPAMLLPMMILAVACLVIGLGAPFCLGAMAPALSLVSGLPLEGVDGVRISLSGASRLLLWIAGGSIGLIFLVALLALARVVLLAGRTIGAAGTWDCGYARPTARMQYTGSSFAQPITHLFSTFLRAKKKSSTPEGYFPREASLETETPDFCTESAWRPLFMGVEWLLARLRWLQTGNVQLYILYIAVTLIALLLWKLS